MTDDEQRAMLGALLQLVIALREGKMRAAGCYPDAETQEEADRRGVVIPARFWRGMLDHEIAAIMTGGSRLDAGHCIRLWECLRRKGQPPAALVVAFNASDLRRLWPRPGTRPQRVA